MPIFTYLAVVGSVLAALLFVADATLEKGTSAIVTSDRTGLPKPWHSNATPSFAGAPAPAPDMTSQLVLAAQPVPEITAKAEPGRAARAEAAAPKKKPVARKQAPDDYRQNQAWWRDRNFGGGIFFGRF
jgi:hypothetical protein